MSNLFRSLVRYLSPYRLTCRSFRQVHHSVTCEWVCGGQQQKQQVQQIRSFLVRDSSLDSCWSSRSFQTRLSHSSTPTNTSHTSSSPSSSCSTSTTDDCTNNNQQQVAPHLTSPKDSNDTQQTVFDENVLSSASVIEHLRTCVGRNSLQFDSYQDRAAKRLQRLSDNLIGYSNLPLHDDLHRHQRLQEQGAARQQEPHLHLLKPLHPVNHLPQKQLEYPSEPSDQKNTPITNRHQPRKVGVYDTSLGIPTKGTSKPFHLKGLEISKVHQEESHTAVRIPRGFYLYGSVGTGKSMLMDAFFWTAPVTKKARFHFHEFLTMIHEQVHQLKQDDLVVHGRDFSIDTSVARNPIERIAVAFSKQTALLCLDEFQVTDIADAMILSQLFRTLFRYGTVLVATSNRSPDNLYEHGLNRSYFLPFIDLLKRHCIVHEMKSKVDYRRIGSTLSVSLLEQQQQQNQQTGSQTSTKLFRSMFITASSFVKNTNELPTFSTERLARDIVHQIRNGLNRKTIELETGYGRTLAIPDADEAGWIARCTFDELCTQSLASSDYRALATFFAIVCIEDIPVLRINGQNGMNGENEADDHNKARRFITLIDELYEAKVALVCISDEAIQNPSDLFVDSLMEFEKESGSGNDMESTEALGIDDCITSCGTTVGALASVRELSFAFQRAASRIVEMTSPRWWHRSLLSSERKNRDVGCINHVGNAGTVATDVLIDLDMFKHKRTLH